MSCVVEQSLALFEGMYIARCVDEKMSKLAKQNKGGTFQLSGGGHELVGVAFGMYLAGGGHWAFPYYRDQAFVIGFGSALEELFGVFLGRATVHHSCGRMMPYHFSDKQLNIYCQSSVVGSQFLHATGRALGIKRSKGREVVYVSAGDGATSQGDFHEALNFASIHQLPVLFVIQDNGYAISVAREEQTGGSLSTMCRGYAHTTVYEANGSSDDEMLRIVAESVETARSGPVVVIAKVPRLQGHSNSDNPKRYQTEEEREQLRERDPLVLLERKLIDLIGIEQVEKSKAEVMQRVEEAARRAEALPYPSPDSTVFAPTSINTSPLVCHEESVVMAEALNHALHEAMEEDEQIIVFGEDVAVKGGVFGVTEGLTAKFGERCFNTPLAESTIIGVAIGLSADGMHKPVVEIQFADYLWTGINQLFNEAASIYYRSAGEWNVPIVVRMPCGGYIQGGPYHSQSIEGFLIHCPGLKVVMPSHAADAKGLLKAAIRDPNPVVFLEHKGLYRQQAFAARKEPLKDYVLELGRAACVREGSDLTLITWGMLVYMGIESARQLAKEGIEVEIIDVRTLVPLDKETLLRSVRKTGKVCIAHEAHLFGGFGAEIAAQVMQEAFYDLDAPIQRLGALERPVPYSKPLEQSVLPQLDQLTATLRALYKM